MIQIIGESEQKMIANQRFHLTALALLRLGEPRVVGR